MLVDLFNETYIEKTDVRIIWKASLAMLSKNLPSSLSLVGFDLSHVWSNYLKLERQMDTPRGSRVHLTYFWQ